MRRTLALVAGSLLVLSGCGGQAEVSTDDLEEQITTQLTEKVGRAPESVTCEDPLPAEEGERVRCLLKDGETELDVDVTASEVDGDNVRFDIQVEEAPN
ncbi:DUF4333 domain-containing protein [Nocardioides aequoreus]|uniref:DUF4333 domain-containing protein n=1 Tax=Nocardioides aequoreus TaxID=397278 RepID=UPI0004C37C5F|nr:DUF4333 domain-containing protein [Nocardioides aequoreus]